MYGKIFASIYEGSLYGQWEAIVTFQQMIVLCDSDGFIDMTPPAIAARTSIPLEIIQKGIELLEQPDKYSRSPDCDGRRIERIDENRPWGWRIVNHKHYRELASIEEKREADRLRIAAKRAAQRESQGVAECRDLSREVANVAYTDTDTDTEKKKISAERPKTDASSPAIPLQDGTEYRPPPGLVAEWKSAYPNIVVAEQLLRIAAWNRSNPGKRKTQRGIAKHINEWLSRADKEAKTANGASQPEFTGRRWKPEQIV